MCGRGPPPVPRMPYIAHAVHRPPGELTGSPPGNSQRIGNASDLPPGAR